MSTRKLIIALCLIFSTAGALQAQNSALYLRGGLSGITGLAGAEFQVGHVGLESGWIKIKSPKLEEVEDVIGFGLSFYTGKPSSFSVYISLGYVLNGAIREEWNETEYVVNWADGKVGMVGFKIGNMRRLDIKIGAGYQISELGNDITFEANIGLALFNTHK